MLSILIPEHNYDCSKLVNDLAEQCSKANIIYEIIVWDDASSLYKIENRNITETLRCVFVESDKNLGSAQVRNSLVKMAQYQHLLMIDCDAEIIDDVFIHRYLDVMNQSPVIIGGVNYSLSKPTADRYLRWFYGKNRECPPAGVRNQNPYKSMLSFNLMIDRDVILKYPYDEQFKDYGHEDSVMGYTLKEAGIKVFHIDNPLIHNGLDLNQDFIAKSLKAVEKYVTNSAFQSDELVTQIKIFKIFKLIQKIGFRKILSLIYRLLKKVMIKNLCSKHPSLLIFDFYRLSYLCYFSASFKMEQNGTTKKI